MVGCIPLCNWQSQPEPEPVTTRRPHSASSPNSRTYCFWLLGYRCAENPRDVACAWVEAIVLSSIPPELASVIQESSSATVVLRYLLTNELLRTAPFKATCQMIEKPQPRQLILFQPRASEPQLFLAHRVDLCRLRQCAA
jgi:hypothetical protein